MTTKVMNSAAVERWKWFIPGILSKEDKESLAEVLERKCWELVNRHAFGDCSDPQGEWNRFVFNTIVGKK